jgi:hypothetical protein
VEQLGRLVEAHAFTGKDGSSVLGHLLSSQFSGDQEV